MLIGFVKRCHFYSLTHPAKTQNKTESSMGSLIKLTGLIQKTQLSNTVMQCSIRYIRSASRTWPRRVNVDNYDADDEELERMSLQLSALEKQLQNDPETGRPTTWQGQRDRERLKIQILRRKYFKEPQEVNLLTWEAKEQIRFLNAEYPDEWTVERLAESFPTTKQGIIKILKSTYVPSSNAEIIKHDAKAIRNVRSLENGDYTSKKLHLLNHFSGIKDLPKSERCLKRLEIFKELNKEEVDVPNLRAGPFTSLLSIGNQSDKKNKIQEKITQKKGDIGVSTKVHSMLSNRISKHEQENDGATKRKQQKLKKITIHKDDHIYRGNDAIVQSHTASGETHGIDEQCQNDRGFSYVRSTDQDDKTTRGAQNDKYWGSTRAGTLGDKDKDRRMEGTLSDKYGARARIGRQSDKYMYVEHDNRHDRKDYVSNKQNKKETQQDDQFSDDPTFNMLSNVPIDFPYNSKLSKKGDTSGFDKGPISVSRFYTRQDANGTLSGVNIGAADTANGHEFQAQFDLGNELAIREEHVNKETRVVTDSKPGRVSRRARKQKGHSSISVSQDNLETLQMFETVKKSNKYSK